MRTTLDLDQSVLQALKELARRDGRTAGAVASDLIRRALSQPAATGVQEPAARYGFRPFAAAAADDRVTNDQVNRLRDDLGI
jgi:negative regulator of replication initiation